MTLLSFFSYFYWKCLSKIRRKNETAKTIYIYGNIAAAMCVLILFGGCASIPEGKFEVLKNSSQSLLTNTKDTYVRIEKMQRRFAVVTAPNSKIDIDTFKPKIGEQSFDLTPELRFRESAFEVLVKYNQVLYGISSKDYMGAVDKASQELAGSLNNLNQSSLKMSKDDASKASGIIATFIDLTGKEIVKGRRADALRKVMDLHQKDIENLSVLIVGSNDKIGKYVKIMVERILTHANFAMRPDYGSASRYFFDMEIAEVIAETEDIQASLSSVNKGVLKIPEAHKEIRDELDKKPTNLDALHSLIQEVENANSFYRTLSK